MADTIRKGKYVRFTYRVSDETGQVAERSDQPVPYVHGEGGVLLPKIELALAGKSVGDVVTVDVPPEEGFGPHNPDLVFTDDIEKVPAEFSYLGAAVTMQSDRGETMIFHVTRIEDGQLTADGNHPYAGRTLRFRLEIVEVRDATDDDRRMVAELRSAIPLKAPH
ncbi:MAG: FKBP-type peptidyl-prolyl cis-trans isomerase [Chromatiales bacterium]|nr:FKBP-type peptidyl-prolyl cis-trans isomerase [Chromatiales bacterium]